MKETKTISQLKTEYIQGLNHLKNDMGMFVFDEIRIGTKNVEVLIGPKRLVFTKYDENTYDHITIFVHLQHRQKKDKWTYGLTESDIEICKKVTPLILEFWRDYAALKKEKGVIFITSKSYISKSYLDESLISEFKQLKEITLSREVTELMDFLYQENSGIFLGAFLHDDYLLNAQKFMQAKSVLDEVFTRNPLLLSKYGRNTKYLFQQQLHIEWAGEKIRINLVDDFEKVRFCFDSEKEQMLVDNNVEEIESALTSIKENNKLKNLITNPMANFERAFSLLPYGFKTDNEYILKREFEKIVAKMGSWEAVEEEAANLRKVMNETEFEEIISAKEEISGSEVKVIQFRTQKYYYSFVYWYYRHPEISFTSDVFVLATKEANSKELRELVYELTYKYAFENL